MKIHLLSGFLGSGKTTAIQQAAQILIQQGVKTGVITNDQGTKLVDGGLFKNLAIPNREVMNGCFCCNYRELDTSIASLIEINNSQVIFAESVGSCTDIIATVLKPLVKFRKDTQVTVSVFADVRLLLMILNEGVPTFDESVRYIYLKQLEEAGIIVINKIDLTDDKQLATIKASMEKKYGNKILVYQNSLNRESIEQWLKVVDNYKSAGELDSLKIDYDIYAKGEVRLAWVDQVLEIFSTDNIATQIAEDLINKIYYQVCKEKYPIGHLKFLLNNSVKISFTSAAEIQASILSKPAASALLLINIRVQALPDAVTQLIAEAIKETEAQSGCTIIISSTAAFQPGYPKPEHRM